MSDSFHQRHLGATQQQQLAQLRALGVGSIEELMSQTVPGPIAQAPDFDLPALTEEQLLDDLRALANQNQVMDCYLGHGYVPVRTPSVIARNVFENPGWYTQYTPYQAEIAQGRLEVLFYYQTLVSDLTGLPVANASLLDEATAAAEAMTMLFNDKNKRKVTAPRFLVVDACLAQTQAVLRTRARGLGIEIANVTSDAVDMSEDIFALLISCPDADGAVRDYAPLVARARDAGVRVIMCCDPLALTTMTPPGEYGVDVACGSMQRYGVPMGFGGPHAAFFATTEDLKRRIPGRVVGVTRDALGAVAYRLALQTREQHIRREKATSNICTAQALLAIISTFYAIHHGPEGLQAMAQRVHQLAQALADCAVRMGDRVKHDAFFDTLQLQLQASPQACQARCLDAGIQVAVVGDCLHVTLSEMATIDKVLRLAKVIWGEQATIKVPPEWQPAWPASCQRSTELLTNEVFHQYRSETELMRYMKQCENKDASLVHRMIPLGSCTMKLNAAAEMAALSWPELTQLHPMAPRDTVHGTLELMDRLADYLAKITGFSAVSMQPNSGAQGEYAGLLAINAYHRSRGDQRDVALVPSSAHGTNPASAVMAGLRVVVVRCTAEGAIDEEHLSELCQQHADRLACIMITYPSTFGVFDDNVQAVCERVHQHGGLVYCDGANLNAQLGVTTPARVGADVCHLNLHKTFCIPHGGGGPGMGPIAVAEHLAPFLPAHPWLSADSQGDTVAAAPYSSASILTISYAYIRLMGSAGLRASAEQAILNANYMAHRLAEHYPILYRNSQKRVAHEFIIDCRTLNPHVKTVDIAKRLMDYGFHAPTLSWPIAETLMIEPTESESPLECDAFCEALIKIRQEIAEVTSDTGHVLANAPHTLAAVTADEWPHDYSRTEAAWPLPCCRQRKFWPSVARVDDAFGDRHLICRCSELMNELLAQQT